MPRFLVERTFPSGLQIPATHEGAEACLSVAQANATEQVTWVHSYVTPDRSKTYAVAIDNDPFEGPADAKITIVKAIDYA